MCFIYLNPIPSRRLSLSAGSRQALSKAEAVDFNDPTQLSKSLCEVWSSVSNSGGRRDLLIMEMVDDQTSGVALTGSSDEMDEALVKGEAPPLHLPQLRAWRRPDPDLPAYGQRLQQLLRGLRRTFGKGDWGIDWMDDGRICWLLRVKDLTGFTNGLVNHTHSGAANRE